MVSHRRTERSAIRAHARAREKERERRRDILEDEMQCAMKLQAAVSTAGLQKHTKNRCYDAQTTAEGENTYCLRQATTYLIALSSGENQPATKKDCTDSSLQRQSQPRDSRNIPHLLRRATEMRKEIEKSDKKCEKK